MVDGETAIDVAAVVRAQFHLKMLPLKSQLFFEMTKQLLPR